MNSNSVLFAKSEKQINLSRLTAQEEFVMLRASGEKSLGSGRGCLMLPSLTIVRLAA
jgi:hypothetical protein